MNREKFLPIKIFEKRKDYDDRSTETIFYKGIMPSEVDFRFSSG